MASFWDTSEQQPATGQPSFWDQEPIKEVAPTRNPAAMLNDYVIEAANAVLGLGKSVVDFAKPGTELAKRIEDLIREGEQSQSIAARQAKQELGEGIDAGGFEAVKAVGRYALTSPGLALSQAAGSFLPIAGAIRGAQGVALATGAGTRAVNAAKAVGPLRAADEAAAVGQVMSRVGTGTGMAIGGIAAGGDAAGDAYSMTYEGLINQGYSEEDARDAAMTAAREASLVPTAIGTIGGALGAEAVFANRGLSTLTRTKRAGANTQTVTTGGTSILRTAGSEALQEAIEEGATKASANIAAGQYVEGIDSMQGVVGSAAMGAVLGGVTGGGVAFLTRNKGSLLQGANDNVGGTPTQETDALANAINNGPQYQQVETDPNKIPRQVAPGIFYTPATGIYTQADGTVIQTGRTPRVGGQEPVGQMEMVGAGAPAFDPNQMTLPGMPPVMQPQPQPPAPASRPPMGAQPGQQELFDTKGTATYGAAPPTYVDFALARMRAEGMAPTRTRMPLAERAEVLFSEEFIDENEYDSVYAMLRDSKYGQAERFLKGVEDARRKQQEQQAAAGVGAVSEQAGADRDEAGAGRADVGQVQPFGAGSFLGRPSGEQDVAAGISGARPSTVGPAAGSVSGDGGPIAGETEVQRTEVQRQEVTVDPEDLQVALSEWNTEYRTDKRKEPRFNQLSPARQAIWAAAVRDNSATSVLFDNLVAEHNAENKNAVQKQSAAKKQTQEVVVWTGKVDAKNQAEGKGTYTWEDGDVFVGEMKAGKVWNGTYTPAKGKPQLVIKGVITPAKKTTKGAVERRGPEGEPTGKSTKAQVDKWFAPILKAWPFGPSVTVVEKVSDLDPAMKASPTAKGGFYKGQIYIVAENATSKLDAMTTLYHEAVGHFGLRSLVRAYSTEYINLMDGIARDNDKVRAEAKKWRERNADRQVFMKLTSAQFRALSIEEAIADMAYQALRNPGLNILSRSQALNNLVKWIAGRVKALGFTDLAKAISQFSADVDVYRLLSVSRKALTQGTRSSVTDPEDNPLFSSVTQTSRWSDARINNLLSTWAYINDENDTKAYAGFVDPQEFLAATSPEKYRLEVLEKENKTLDKEALAGENQPIFLLVERDMLGKKDTAYIIGHEGRHRMMALRDAGIRQVPVVFINGYTGQRMSDTKPIDSVTLTPREDEGEVGFTAYNLTPLSFGNREQIKQIFGVGPDSNLGNADVVFRDAGAVTPAERTQINQTIKNFTARLNPNNYSKGRKALLGLRFLTDIRDNLGYRLDGLRDYVSRSLAMGATTNELLKEGSQIATRWANLGKEAEVLNKLAAGATSQDIHPDIPLDQDEHKSGPTRKVSNRHFFNADGKINDAEVENNHKILSEMFNKLSPEAKDVYYAARDFMNRNWNRRQELLNNNIETVFRPLIAEAKATGNDAKVKALEKEKRQFISEFGRQLARVRGPYFPLSRFGNFYVVYKSDTYKNAEAELNDASKALTDLYNKFDVPTTLRKEVDAANRVLVKLGDEPIAKLGEEAKKQIKDAREAVRVAQKKVDALVKEGQKHFVSEAFESEASANARARELGVEPRLAEEYFRELNPVNRAFIERLSGAVGAALPGQQALDARQAMIQIYLAALPQTSALKNEIKRRGIAGWDSDMQRAFADYTQKDAHYLSRLEHADEMNSDLLRMKRAAGTKQQDELYNEMARRHVASLKYHQSPVEDGLSSLAFIYQLGISPAFLLTNMSQPWMVSMPFMTGKHSTGSVVKALGEAFGDAGKAAVTAVREQGFFFEMDLNKFSGKEKEMLENAMKAGLLDVSLALDIGAYARGGRKGISKVMHAMGVMPHQVEVVNRTMTALAAYRLEIAAGRSHEQAMEYANSVLDKTHMNYSATNAPYWLKPGVVPFGKVLFQYRKFQLGMLTLMANQFKQAFKGDATSRKEARRALYGIFAMHGLMTGAVGLPAAGTIFMIANLLNAIFGDEDEPFDAEAEFRLFLAEAFGVDNALVVAKGLPTLLGVDLSRNLGMGDVAAPIRVLRSDKEGRDLYLEILAAGLGPTIGGLGPQFAEGIQMLMKGDLYRGAEGLTPRFMRDLIRAARLEEQGLTTKTGQVVFTPEEISAWDKAIQAVGFPSTRISERGAAAGAVQEARKFLQDRRSELIKDYVAARRANDTAAMAAVQAEIKAFNEKRQAKKEPTLKPKDLLNAYKQRERYTKQLNEQGVSLSRSERALGAYGAFASVQ
jgi:hypothetical protein